MCWIILFTNKKKQNFQKKDDYKFDERMITDYKFANSLVMHDSTTV